MIRRESLNTSKSCALNSSVACKSIIHASYSVTLLVQGKLSLIEIGIYCPLDNIKIAPTPLLVELAAPSKNNFLGFVMDDLNIKMTSSRNNKEVVL